MMKHLQSIIFALPFFLLNVNAFPAYSQSRSDFPDVHVFPSDHPQSEVNISINPTNPQNLIMSCNDNVGYTNVSYFFSTDEGNTWNGSEILQGYNNIALKGDPSTTFDANGNAYLSFLNSNLSAVSLQLSTNEGYSWSNMANPSATYPADKPFTTCDNYPSSPYVNNLYCGWSYLTGTTSRVIKIDHSVNSGQSFIDTSTFDRSGEGVNVQTDADGDVYVCWADYGTPLIYPASSVGFAYSTDGGHTFSTPDTAFTYSGIDFNGTDADPRFNDIRVNAWPSMAIDKSNSIYKNRIYIVYPEEVNNKAVIQFRYSTDHGATWPVNNKVTISEPDFLQSFFPWISVDPTNGDIYVVYYAFDQSSGFSTDTYVAYSHDGGNTFQNIKVSDVSHITQPIYDSYAGDYIGIVAYCGQAWAAWMDDRNGTWQIYVSKVAVMHNISGPDTLCSSGTYSVTNMSPNATVTWSASPAGVVSLTPIGDSVTVNALGSGNVTLTAAILNPCQTTDTVNKVITAGTPSGAYISYEAHTGGSAYLFTYNGQFANPPVTYFEMQSLNNVPIYAWPPGSNKGLPPSTLYDVYGVGISLPSGTAEVRARFMDQCGWSDWSETFDLPGENAPTRYSVSPNPAQNTITIVSNNENKDRENIKFAAQPSSSTHDIKQVMIYNASGKLIRQQYFSGSPSRVDMSVSGLTNGVYFIHVTDSYYHEETHKLIIAR